MSVYEQYGPNNKHDFPGGLGEQNNTLKGDPFSPLEHRHTWERAVVQAVYPDKHSCDVYTERGKYLAGVSWPDGGRKAPRRGDTLVVHFQLGKPMLVSANPDAVAPAKDQESHHVAPVRGVGGEDTFYAGKGSGEHRGDRPRDILPGDWVEVGSMGNMIGVLEGGTTIIKANELAQIIATQAKHMLRLVGKNLKLDTGAGTLDFRTEDGKSTINLYAGADEETESSPSADNFRIRCELGTDGEMVDFRVTDPQGRSVYRVHVDPDGRVQKKSQRETYVVKEDRRTEVGTNDQTFVGGDRTVHTGGEVREESGGGRTVKSGGSARTYAAQNVALNAMQDLILNAARNVYASSSGSVTSTDPSTAVDVMNGDLSIDIGNPVKGDAQVVMSGLSVDTFTGDMDFSSVLGSFNVNTNAPDSVNLGGPVPGTFSAVLYELFSAFMELFGTMIDTHIHPVPALGGLPTGPPAVSPWAFCRPVFEMSKSNFVSFGG